MDLIALYSETTAIRALTIIEVYLNFYSKVNT